MSRSWEVTAFLNVFVHILMRGFWDSVFSGCHSLEEVLDVAAVGLDGGARNVAGLLGG